MAIEVKVKIKIKGISDYLQHKRPVEDDSDSLKKKGSIDYSKEAEKSVYSDEEIGCYIPSKHLRGCLVKAGTAFKITGQGQKTFKDLINATIEIEPDKIPLNKDTCDYTHSEWVKIKNRDQIMRFRPAFKKGWEAEFKLLMLDEERLPKKALEEILSYAGKFVGIGDWRPHFGRFEVVSFE